MRANAHSDHGGDRCRMFYRARVRAHEANGLDAATAREKALADSQANGCRYVPRTATTITPKPERKPAAKPKPDPAPAPWHSWGL